jgi:oxygen-independent coproporphyrinogen-3 oxidase
LLDGVRAWNIREWAAYAAAVRDGRALVAGAEQLSEEQQALERLYLGLRTIRGLPADEIPADDRDTWLREGWATVDGGRLRLTASGWLRLDALVSRVGVP